MKFEISESDRKRAQLPHNLLISGLFGFNLLMAPAVLALKLGMIGLLIPLFSTGALIMYLYLRSRQSTIWFVDAHWRLAFRNSRWLMRGYAVTAVLVFVAWLVSLTAHNPSMGHIIWTALTRIAILPTLAGVMITAITEASAISLATKHEVPDELVASFPPPG
ncbi:MAG: hypothetical protein NTY60_07865 [Proteobacteria bacterium]|nr:hypothetical protein [Pseudomonadota bacterium]